MKRVEVLKQRVKVLNQRVKVLQHSVVVPDSVLQTRQQDVPHLSWYDVL